jgi:glycosyltransferase involved in cell wall biosynthesis
LLEGDERVREKPNTVRVLVVLGSPYLYGMERAVIERFAFARPEVDPRFLLAHATKRKNLPILDDVARRGLAYTFFSDFWDWPRLGKPRSIRGAFQILLALILGNLDVVRASWRLDALYVPNQFALIHAFLASILFRLRRHKIVFDFHDQPNRPLLSLRLLHPLITDFVVGSRVTYEGVRTYHPYLPESKLHFIRQAVQDVHVAAPARRPPLDTTRRNLLFIGQVRKEKGPDLLLEAFSLVTSEFPDAHLHFVGGFGDRYEEMLRNRIKELGLNSRVTFWGYRPDASAMLDHAYLYVQPTRPSLFTETFGRGVVEAMSAGVPSLIFQSGGLAESVVHGKTGLVCADETAACLADGLRTLLMDRALRDRYGRAARERYESDFAPPVTRPQWLTLFGILAREAPGGN